MLDQGTALARRYGYDYRYVECRFDDVDLLDRRVRNRVSLRSQRTGVNCPPPDASGGRNSEDYRALLSRRIENPCRPAGDAIAVDSTDSPEEYLDYILRQIVPPTDNVVCLLKASIIRRPIIVKEDEYIVSQAICWR